ncbi:MAG: GAF domain-containing sensor histidine kinase, partial [Chloroflexi bacterium]|nr:GAF domain-containing sensor histidine kinase [Chloroflexota bacterium]
AERGLETYILRHHHHLQALDRISTAVSGLWDLDAVLNVSLEGVLEIMSGAIGGILILDPDTHKLRYRAHRGLSSRFVDEVQIPPGEGIAGRVAETGQAILVEDISLDPRTAYPEQVSTEGLKGFAAVPLKSKEKTLGVMTIASREPGHFGADDLYLLNSIGCQVGTAIERAELYERLDRARERYKTLLQHSLTAQEDARKRIARELHDETSQVITSLALNLQALKSMAEAKGVADPDFVRAFDKSLSLATHAGHEIVRMMKALRPTLLDEMGLAAAVNRYARDTLEPRGIRVHTEFRGMEGRRLPSEIEVTLFRVSQGVIGNIREHSGASNAYITIEAGDKECIMTIRDDGKGFDLSKITRVDKSGRGAGLFIMKERVDLVGGTGGIHSEPGKGTEIVIRVPLQKELADA